LPLAGVERLAAKFSRFWYEHIEKIMDNRMSRNPLGHLPAFNQVSIRAVLVSEGEDAGPALSEAGIVNPIAIPVVRGETLDLSGGILGDGLTPNLTAVLETR
jgi:hypothetical protein